MPKAIQEDFGTVARLGATWQLACFYSLITSVRDAPVAVDPKTVSSRLKANLPKRFTATRPSEALGNGIANLCPGARPASSIVSFLFEKSQQTKVFGSEIDHASKSDEELLARASIHLCSDAQEKPRGLTLAARAVNGQQRAEKTPQDRHRTLPDAMFVVNIQGQVVRVNARVLRSFGSRFMRSPKAARHRIVGRDQLELDRNRRGSTRVKRNP